MHQKIGYVIIYNLEKIKVATPICITIAFIVSVVMAYLIHTFVEIPAIVFLKKGKKKI